MSRYGDGRRDGMSRCPCCQHQHTLVLVGCGATKQPGEHEARDLYTGTLFRKARAFAEQHGDDWFILSAGYGLLYPQRRIGAYDRTLKGARQDFVRMWNKGTQSQLWGFRDSRIIVLAGNDYCGWIDHKEFPYIERPMEGMSIGQQLQYLTQHTTKADADPAPAPTQEEPTVTQTYKLTPREVRSEFNRRWHKQTREWPAMNSPTAALRLWRGMLDELWLEGRITAEAKDALPVPDKCKEAA